jgi:nucleoside phosphorylase
VLLATEVANHQAGKETPAGFEPQKEKTEDRSQKSEYRQQCEELREVAGDVATEILRSAQNDKREMRAGRLVSGDAFIASSAKRKWLRDTFKADAVDMVSAGIARVCEANGVPYVIIRVLSDNADESASADFSAFIQKNEKPVIAEIALKLIDRLVVTPPPR